MTKKVFYTFTFLFVAVLLGAAACQKQTPDSSDGALDQLIIDETVPADETVPVNEDGAAADDPDAVSEDNAAADDSNAIVEEGEVKTFNLEAGMFYFSLKEITVNKGDKVKIVLNNAGGMHDWVIDEFSARTPQIKAGETATIEFTADKTGTFEYYCSVGNHRQQGMVGKLTVN